MSLKFNNLRMLSNPPGANELSDPEGYQQTNWHELLGIFNNNNVNRAGVIKYFCFLFLE